MPEQQKPNFGETGDSGVDRSYGNVMEAYLPRLQWPSCVEIYNRIYRSDPEVAICRNIIDAFANQVTIRYTAPENVGSYKGKDTNPTDTEKKAVDFGNQLLEDMLVKPEQWLASCISKVLFYGWGWWEVLWGVRQTNWKSPGEDDGWRSSYNDGLIGIRDFAFRHYSTFEKWEFTEKGRVLGLWQKLPTGQDILLPSNKAVHIKFGNTDSPEGLSALETIYRLEKYAYQLEIVQGMGFEHAAGYLNINVDRDLTPEDETRVRTAARNIMTAQQGNYALWPQGIIGDVKSTPFNAGEPILNAIRFYSILKLAVVNMQWATIGTISPYGTYSTMADATTFFILWFNSIVQMFVNQLDTQISEKIYSGKNLAEFPGLVQRPVLKADRVHKIVNLIEIGQFLMAIKPIMPLLDEDWQAIRARSEFLPELSDERMAELRKMYDEQQQKEYDLKAGKIEEANSEESQETETETETETENEEEAENQETNKNEEMALRPVGVSSDEFPIDITSIVNDLGTAFQVNSAVAAFRAWAKKERPDIAALLDAKID